MNSFKLIKTQKELREILKRLDSISKPYNPVDSKRRSLHSRLYATPKPSVDELEEITEIFGDIIDDDNYYCFDKDGNVIDECQEICARLIDLYYSQDCYQDSLLLGDLFFVFFLNLEDEIEKWISGAEQLDVTSLQKLHVLDCFIDSYLKVGNDFKPNDDQLSTLSDLFDALEEQIPEKWRFEVDNLRRQLDLCRAALKYSDDEDFRDRYVELCQDLLAYAIPSDDGEQRETDEDAEKFYFIKDITKDKEKIADYLKYATTMTDIFDEESLADLDNYLKYLSL